MADPTHLLQTNSNNSPRMELTQIIKIQEQFQTQPIRETQTAIIREL
jgi:hypothetical protein